MTEALAGLLRLNLALAAAVALALALRLPLRRLFGPRIAYGLWGLVPLAAAAVLLPARVVTVIQAVPAAWGQSHVVVANAGPAAVAATGPSLSTLAMGLWLIGGLASLGWLAWRQVQFARALRAGRAGPAVIGVVRPRIVTPDDFAQRYSDREQGVVLAHERTHIARQDSRANAAVALLACVNWFNPLVHLLAHYLRIDQELACDAAVVAAHPTARRTYAEAMLKTQLAARPLPLGCYWPAQAAHPLAQRIGLLARPAPGRATRVAGGVAVAALVLGCAVAAWAARPAEVRVTTVPLAMSAPATPDPIRLAAPTLAPPTGPSTPLRLKPAAPPQQQQAASPPSDMPLPAPTDPWPAGPNPLLLPAGFFGAPDHPRRVRALSQRSVVEPGSAVRVVATMDDPDGGALTTDLTAFGSQSFYRLGYIERHASHQKLFTSVEQHGDRFTITAALNDDLASPMSGSITLGSGEAGKITLPNGLVVKVVATVRPETPDEMTEGQRIRRPYMQVDRAIQGL